MKKILVFLMALVLILSACSKKEEGMIEIGISQFAQHPSLDNVREGILEGLSEEGFIDGENMSIDYKNSDAIMDNSTQIAKSFTSDKKDLIFAIATPSAMTGFNAIQGTDIPLIYAAINDPIGAQLANDDGTPSGNATGYSDALPVEMQLKMIREILPEAKSIGIIYTTSEANSISTIEIYKELASKYDFKLEVEGISSSQDISLATDSLLQKVDAITNLTDNTVVNSLPTILSKANEKNIPVFGSEVEQVKAGCLAAQGIDYLELGRNTGKMAAKILRGESKASEMHFKTMGQSNLYINLEVMQSLEIKISEELKNDAKEVFEKIEG